MFLKVLDYIEVWHTFSDPIPLPANRIIFYRYDRINEKSNRCFMGKVIAVSVPKGGVGKTTSVVNLAASFAVGEKKTIIIDFDPSGSCSIALGFTPEKIKGDIFEVISYAKSIDKVIHQTGIPYLDFIPSVMPAYQQEQRLEKLAANLIFIVNTIQTITPKYDYILIDCPPYLKGMTTNALAVADTVLIPVRAESFSLGALLRMMEHIEFVRKAYNPGLKIEGIFFTMYESNTRVSTLAKRELEQKYKPYLLQSVIPKNVAVTEASFLGIPAVLHQVDSKGSQAYLNLAGEIIGNHY